MFDIGAAELLVIVVVAILVIGPKEMPRALRHAGRWIGKIRRMSSHFRSGIDAMVREAEMEEAEKEWKARNARIMAEHPDAGGEGGTPKNLLPEAQMEPVDSPSLPDPNEASARAEAAIARAKPSEAQGAAGDGGTASRKNGDV